MTDPHSDTLPSHQQHGEKPSMCLGVCIHNVSMCSVCVCVSE